MKLRCAPKSSKPFVRTDNVVLPPLVKVTLAQLDQRPDLLSGLKPFMLLDSAKAW